MGSILVFRYVNSDLYHTGVTHECYINFDFVRISHRCVKYWNGICDVLGTNLSQTAKCEICGSAKKPTITGPYVLLALI